MRKITRKELREPDQFHTISERIVVYLIEHRKKFYMAAASVLLIIIVACGWFIYGLQYEKRADRLYSSAFNSYTGDFKNDRDRYLNSIELYGEITANYPRSRAAILSFYNIGNIYYNIKEIDKSIEAYRSFLARSPEDTVLTSLTYYGLGYCHEEKEEYEEALKSFENSNRFIVGTHFNVINYSNIARIYEKMNMPEKALEYYNKVLEGTEDNFLKTLVKSKLATLS